MMASELSASKGGLNVITATLGFARAADKREGDYVAFRGLPCKIVFVRREGKDWPYFYLEECRDWVSWQNCGDFLFGMTGGGFISDEEMDMRERRSDNAW